MCFWVESGAEDTVLARVLRGYGSTGEHIVLWRCPWSAALRRGSTELLDVESTVLGV